MENKDEMTLNLKVENVFRHPSELDSYSNSNSNLNSNSSVIVMEMDDDDSECECECEFEFDDEIICSYLSLLAEEEKEKNVKFTVASVKRLLSQIRKYDVLQGNFTIAMAMAFVYLRRLIANNIQLLPNALSTSIYCKFVICVMMADKMLSDQPYNNYSYSKISLITLEDINEMELQFLKSFDYSISISKDEFDIIIKAFNSSFNTCNKKS